MSHDIDILVNAELSLDGLAQEIEALLGMLAHRKTDNDETWYEFQDEHTFLTLGNHDYVNDQGIDFESYEYDIQVFAINIKAVEERQQELYKSARRIFHTLQETHKYALLLVDNLQVKLDEFIPEVYQKEPSQYAIQSQTLPEDIQLFVTGDISFEDFSQELERLLNVPAKLRLKEQSDRKWYELRTQQAIYFLYENSYLDIYPEYQYEIDIQGRVYIPGERRYWQYESAHTLFEQLKATGRYRIVFAGELFEKLAEFAPES
jgi:hypothetical protein